MINLERKETSPTVRVSIPAKVAYNLDSLNKGIANLMDRLGHPQCFSGVNCGFMLEREFVIDERAKISAISRADAPAVNPVSAKLPGKVGYNLELVQKSVASIVDRLGCGSCCSGFDIFFDQELNFLLGNDAKVLG
ncbi:MAG: hypothetical protein WBW88_11295 [Rhodothermales bacterium]